MTLDGGGSILFAGGWGRNEITGANTSTPTTLHNVNNQITGFGFIGNGGFANAPANLLFLDNQAAGVINATSGTGQPLTLIDLTVGNAGTIEATGAGGLAITSATIAQTATGVTEAVGAGTHIDLTAATLRGGTLRTSGGGVVNVYGVADLLDGNSAGALTISASILIASSNVSEALLLKGTLHNSGTITLQAGNNTGNSTLDQAEIYIQTGDVTLDGGGSVVFAGTWGHNEITGANTSTPTTLHNVDNKISGFGSIGVGTFSNAPGNKLILDNETNGTIDATAGATLTINTGATITNNGTLEADGGTLVVDDAVTGSAAPWSKAAVRSSSTAASRKTSPSVAPAPWTCRKGRPRAGGYTGQISGWGLNDAIDLTTLQYKSSYRVVVGPTAPPRRCR